MGLSVLLFALFASHPGKIATATGAGSLREEFADAYYHSMGEERPEVVAYRQGMAAIDKAAEGMGIYDPGYIPNRWQA